MTRTTFATLLKTVGVAFLLLTLLFGVDVSQSFPGFIGSALREIAAVTRDPDTQWMIYLCLTVWCGFFAFLTFNLDDLPLIGLLLVATVFYSTGQTTRLGSESITFLAGLTMGKGAKALSEIRNQKLEIGNFLLGLIVLLAFSSCWHLDMLGGGYHGPRWMGLWNNPNIYGMLMSAGVVLTIGMLIQNLKSEKLEAEMNKRDETGDLKREMVEGTGNRKAESGKVETSAENQKAEIVKAETSRFLCPLRSFVAKKSLFGEASGATPDATRGTRVLPIFLLVAAGMMAVGLVMSYSRGAWSGTVAGLIYLAWSYGKLKWRYVLAGMAVLAAVVLVFWGRTSDSAPWYIKRMDLGRPSAQHRVAAWHGALQMMRDHPFGVGWNKAVEIYQKNYSPPEGGAAAIGTNDYLMLGTQLGIPGLACFVAYIALAFRRSHQVARIGNSPRHGAATAGPIIQPSNNPQPPTPSIQQRATSVLPAEIGRVTPSPPPPEPPSSNQQSNYPESMAPTPRPPLPIHQSINPLIQQSALQTACRSAAVSLLVAFWFDGGLFTLATASVFWILLELGTAVEKLKS